ncbi:MAG: TlpA disulfide reductase family protein [Pseudomonadota bacterium]
MKIGTSWLFMTTFSLTFGLTLGLTLGLTCISPCWAVDVAKVAPVIKARQIDGHTFDLAANAGNVIIINFWATWCAPCRQEMPALESYYRQHQAEGLRIIAISMDDPADDQLVQQVMREYSFAAAFRREADYKGYGRIWRMPMTFIIDRHGVLRKDGSVGDPKVDLAILEKIVTPLLRETP